MERRKFISITGTGMAALTVMPSIASGSSPVPGQGKKLRVGLIGAGGFGMIITRAALAVGGVEIVAVCDVDSEHLDSASGEIEKLQGSKPEKYKYYRELLDSGNLQAVFIATPPHWHALQFIAACEKGLDIYCEKPLAYDIMEGLAMVRAAEKAGNIVQIGFQRRQSRAFSKTRELIAAGRIGEIHQVVAQINYVPEIKDTTIQQPPASLDWDEWCGPAPRLDYRPNIGHVAWRLEKEYGNGHLVDWGIHHIDIIRKIMGEGMPSRFMTTGGIFSLPGKISTPDTLTSQMDFSKAPLLWQHRLWGIGDPVKDYNNGIFFHGEKGTIFAEDSRVVILEAGKGSKREELDIETPAVQEDHMRNFLTAVQTRDKESISCKPDDAFRSTATVQLAMISYYSGSMVRWNEKMNEISGNAEASKLMAREYRTKFRHP